ncbi:MAG: hypothetical protein F4213_18785 [Boseongicola sp. SB0677_bin_26]|nr:hypothetical protein [Boseongicola sp. SB0665_bin_10]MYG28037.1 hypothetical protein [Boseongicola sp. SB0677_bin_26]
MTDQARKAFATGHGRPFVQFEAPVPREDTPEGRAAAFQGALRRFLAERDSPDHQDMKVEGEGTR